MFQTIKRRRMPLGHAAAGILAALSLAAPQPGRANSIVEQQTSSMRTEQVEKSPVGFRNGSLIVAPIPFSNPMIGAGLTLGVGYLFKLDEGSDTSGIGAAALRSDNGSQGALAGGSFKFQDNRWQMALYGGRADLQYDLYAGDQIVPLRQEGVFGQLTLGYGFTPDTSLSFVTRYLDTSLTSQEPLIPILPPELQPALDLAIVNLGIEASWDTRDDSLYPTSGFHLKGSAQRGFVVEGVGFDYTKTYALLDSYYALGENTVIASRSAICGATEFAPFFDACSVGGVDAFRGFNSTQLNSTRSMSAQVELRQRIGTRLGLVAFGGIGGAGPGFDTLSTGAAGGIGVRYRVSKKFPVDFSIDASINDEQEKLLYISVGQRF